MISPEDEKHWCKADYISINNSKSFSYIDNFCDETGNVGEKFPNSKWENDFIYQDEKTTVNILIRYENLEH